MGTFSTIQASEKIPKSLPKPTVDRPSSPAQLPAGPKVENPSSSSSGFSRLKLETGGGQEHVLPGSPGVSTGQTADQMGANCDSVPFCALDATSTSVSPHDDQRPSSDQLAKTAAEKLTATTSQSAVTFVPQPGAQGLTGGRIIQTTDITRKSPDIPALPEELRHGNSSDQLSSLMTAELITADVTKTNRKSLAASGNAQDDNFSPLSVMILENPVSNATGEEPPRAIIAELPPKVLPEEPPLSTIIASQPPPRAVIEEPLSRAIIAEPSLKALHDEPPPRALHDEPPPRAIHEPPSSTISADPPPSEPPLCAGIDEPPPNAVLEEHSRRAVIDEQPPSPVISEPPSGAILDKPPSSPIIDEPPSSTNLEEPPPSVLIIEPPATPCVSPPHQDVDIELVPESPAPPPPPPPAARVNFGKLKSIIKRKVRPSDQQQPGAGPVRDGTVFPQPVGRTYSHSINTAAVSVHSSQANGGNEII